MSKSGLAIMIGMKPPKKEESKDSSSYGEESEPKVKEEKEESREEEDDGESKLSSAEDVLSAVKSGDTKEFASALERFIKHCSY